MLDTMVFDLLVADDEGRRAVLDAIGADRLRLRTTHVQEDQLAAIPDESKRAHVAEIPREIVPTSVMVWGTSKWGMASWGGSAEYEAIRHDENHIEDAMIAATATTDAHVLVTEDKRLRNRARERLRVPVWDAKQLIAWAASGDRTDDSPLGKARRVLEESEFLDLERRVEAQGEVLKTILDALRQVDRELDGGRRPPPRARY